MEYEQFRKLENEVYKEWDYLGYVLSMSPNNQDAREQRQDFAMMYQKIQNFKCNALRDALKEIDEHYFEL